MQIHKCDLCDEPAVDEITVSSKNTTPIKRDVCMEHLSEYKRIMRVFLRQELPPKLSIEDVDILLNQLDGKPDVIGVKKDAD